MEVESLCQEEEENRLTQLRFEAAVKVIKSLPADGPFQPSNDMMLKFYSYYKQATLGLCNTPRPGFWDVVGKAKWDAWNSLGDMSKEAAMAAYVDEMKLILEGMPMTSEVEELLRVIGPFYELADEKKKISQISDLSAGFSSTINSLQSKSFTKSIIRNMEINNTLEAPPTRVRSNEGPAGQETDEDEGEDEDDEEEEEETMEKEIRKASPPKKKSSSRRHKAPLPNGTVTNGVLHLTNGGSQCSANSEDAHLQQNGLYTDLSADTTGANHLLSDSDSEVYCDSVDQFGQETSEHNQSMDDLEEEDGHLLPPDEAQDEVQELPQGVQCGGEEGEAGGMSSQRHNTSMETTRGSVDRRGRGSRSPGNTTRPPLPVQGGGGGGGRRWGGASTPVENLNEQIVVALSRLQEDMQSVLERLHTLEALTASQARSAALSPSYALPPVTKKTQTPSWWPFDISPSSLAFAVVWPFVVQWLISLYLHRRRRRTH
ncbi:acyl-CoA-binding domain-containing protein 5A [Gouania willdenowi]|uniref:acyl-CoA-binding domain-containing protein 5A n=1 Tax=Gouania willdenowi TaxID=441366 RepID=UPI001055193C|nr:acyl-CoA-binding domain-containing protein 5 [Gouania willdenowi]